MPSVEDFSPTPLSDIQGEFQLRKTVGALCEAPDFSEPGLPEGFLGALRCRERIDDGRGGAVLLKPTQEFFCHAEFPLSNGL